MPWAVEKMRPGGRYFRTVSIHEKLFQAHSAGMKFKAKYPGCVVTVVEVKYYGDRKIKIEESRQDPRGMF